MPGRGTRLHYHAWAIEEMWIKNVLGANKAGGYRNRKSDWTQEKERNEAEEGLSYQLWLVGMCKPETRNLPSSRKSESFSSFLAVRASHQQERSLPLPRVHIFTGDTALKYAHLH